MKKVIILRKVRVIMKTFAPTFFDYFSLCLSKKKMCDNEAVVCSHFSEAVVRTYSSKKVFLKISQILQENTCVFRTDSKTGVFL